MKKTLIILLAAFSAACSPGLKLQTSQSVATDTVIVTERVRDTVVVLERDRSMLRALLECDSLGQVQLKRILDWESGKRIRPPEVTLNKNILTARAQVDSMAIYLTLKERIERRTATRKELQVVEVNRLNRWQKVWMRTGQVLTAVLLVFGAFRIRNRLKI